jgi:hypothetical protein
MRWARGNTSLMLSRQKSSSRTFDGYYGDSEKTAEALTDSRYSDGELGTYDEYGLLLPRRSKEWIPYEVVEEKAVHL